MPAVTRYTQHIEYDLILCNKQRVGDVQKPRGTYIVSTNIVGLFRIEKLVWEKGGKQRDFIPIADPKYE